MAKLQWLTFAIAAVLQVLLISSLMRGPYRKYPLLLAFAVGDVLGSVVGAAALFDLGRWTEQTAKYYWMADGVQYTLLFACQVHLLSKTIDDRQSRGRLLYIVLGGVCFAAFAAWQSYAPRPSLWMTQLIRNLSFGSMLVNLMLWTMLARRPARQLLLITAGFGIHLAGGAIGHSLRQLSPSLVTAGNLILIGSYLLCLFILWQAIRMPAAQSKPRDELAEMV
ncbi:MAG: hypothetical protein HY235_15690 [Acidobacteria bacterium]|nr:hypothetical protein [Acidobacteriota bacterium]